MNSSTVLVSTVRVFTVWIAGALLWASEPVSASPARVDQLIKTAAQLDADPERGEQLYRQHCQSCHGEEARGSAAELVPALAGQRRAYLIKQLADFAELERIATRMHQVVARAEVGEPQEWSDLTAYLNGVELTAAPQTGSGEWLSLGEAAFEQWCASCHGDDGHGDDDGFVPSVRNQHYSYLLHQLRQLSSGHRFNVESDLVLFLDSLDQDEMAGLADYMSRIRGPVRDRTRLHDDGTAGD